MNNKTCTKCNIKKQFEEFDKRSKSPDGHYPSCKECRKKFRQENKDKINKNNKIYREKNTLKSKIYQENYKKEHEESLKNYRKQHYLNNRNKKLNYQKTHYENNKKIVQEYRREWYKNNKDKINIKRKINHKNDPRIRMFKSAQSRHKKDQSIKFEITIDDIILPERCPVFNFILEPNDNLPNKNSPTLDRIIPELGYIKGNIQVISYLANTIKNNATLEQLYLFANWVLTEKYNFFSENYDLILIKKFKTEKLKRLKINAKKRNLDFNITKNDFEIPLICPILGINLKLNNKITDVSSPSIDRIDNSKGYIKGNVQVISHLANTMKSNATPEELKLFANWVKKNI